MNTEPITIESISPKEIVIINHEPLEPNTPLQLNLNRKLEKLESGFRFYLSASISKESEKNAEEKTFFIKYSLETHFNCDYEESSLETLQKEATIIMYPHIRAGISAAMGAVGIHPIVLPPYIIE